MNHFAVLKSVCISSLLSISVSVHSAELGLNEAINYALNHEPWLKASKQKQSSIEAKSIAAGTLPDPVLTLGLMNLPTNGFAFDQENMTQFKVGISQSLSRGDSLALQQKALSQSAAAEPWLRKDRLAQVKTIVTESWLNAYRAQRSIALIEQDKALFTQLIDITESSYVSSVGKTRQQDIIRAQLELTRLEDKLIQLEQQLQGAKKRLTQWLPIAMLSQPVSDDFSELTALKNYTELEYQQLMTMLLKHPAIMAMDNAIVAKQTQISVAEQGYKPQIGVNMGYGYRDDMPMGGSRADLFSVGISIDLPLFTDNRQDQLVNAAIADSEEAKTQKLIALKKLQGMYFKEVSQLARLHQRAELYQAKLLPQMAEQAQATLNAYTRDDGNFSDVMQARISQLNAKIDALNIHVDQKIIIARLNYYASADDTSLKNTPQQEPSYEY
ncbi:TolC family protein [Pseudoalteromonas sp. meg-B1]|uniref:TolC family protein n=2 Tax=unclassified Pseudoalteromonas TaxID=194690 RepID=UPI000D6F19C0|nr:TolC family protein [Pseudoalteromonas sp. meg-B1]PWS55235.1 transporter [Pseudoalteromonas sp. meg-B1]